MSERVAGQKVILNLHKKYGYTRPPKPNYRSIAVGRCAREAGDPDARKRCFGMSNDELMDKNYLTEDMVRSSKKE